MKLPEVHTIDFETEGIESRPKYPPKPVGVSIRKAGQKKSKYYAWGHPTQNNCDYKEAQKALAEVWTSRTPLLFHNGKFDIDVAETHMEMKELPWERYHDTQFLLFLNDPHSMSLALKPSAERLLNMKPEERDAVKDWLLGYRPELVKGQKGQAVKDWGKYICEAPGKLVGKYAEGDTDRTFELFKFLWPKIAENGMLGAYDRERQLMRIFLENERVGLRIDMPSLRRDIPMYQAERAKAEKWLHKKLKVDSDFNFDSDADLAEVLDRNGVVTEWEMTKTGKRSTSKKTMTVEKFNDKKIFFVLGYRNRLTTCLGTFLEPWLEKGEATGGFINPNWNQVRQPSGEDGSKGTRTGRPSCDNPNLLNLAKSFEDRGDDYTHPAFIKDLRPLPLIRRYTLPDKGNIWLHRDYNQQELRILAHFENGAIMDAYNKDPNLDIHTFVQSEIERITGRKYDRTSVKTMNFGKLYGQGLGSLAEKLHKTVDDVKSIRDAQNKALPGLPDLEKQIKALVSSGEPIVTWGGRIYYVEPPKFVEKFGREMTFEYKMLNYLIQGSAADATKEAIIRFHSAKKESRFLVTVYDEINISAPKKAAKQEMKILRECMEGLEFDVPMVSDGKAGENWGSLEKVKW